MKTMVKKFGISLDEEIANRVEAPLEYGDKRSERIQHLIIAGLAVENALEQEGYNLEVSQTHEIRSFVRQVFDAYEE